MTRVVVTDIEGTTSALSFVKDVLFPYARRHLGDYIRQHATEQPVSEQLVAIRTQAGGGPGSGPALDDIIALLNQWIDEDRKVTPLKVLQGLVWEQGYRNGDFHGHVYPDAVDALRAWHQQGVALYVYSSGSVHAQQLLFSHTEYGDLTPLFSGYFDTRVGPKGEAGSYRSIAEAVAVDDVHDILFLSDIDTELAAARAAGFQTWQLVRDGEINPDAAFRQARSFVEISL